MISQSENHRQLGDPNILRRFRIFDLLERNRKLQIRQSLEQRRCKPSSTCQAIWIRLTEYDLQLCLRQPLRNAPVLTIPEAKRVYRVEFAMHVERVWAREDVCVAIAGLTRCFEACSFFNGLPLISSYRQTFEVL